MSHSIRLSRRRFLLGGTALLAGCAGLPIGDEGPAVEAPRYRVGDRWIYRAQDGFMTPLRWEETWEVTRIGPEGIAVHVTQRGPSTNVTRDELWSAPGLVRVGAVFDEETRRFNGDLKRYDFPLVRGKQWNQWIDNYNETTRRAGTLNRWGAVSGWRKIATPAGTFDAIAIRVYMHLDDDEFWRERTDCTYLLWYAPVVRGTVREEKQAQYMEKSSKYDTAPIRSQSALVELVSFTPGA